jgi:hypothetical protein
VVRFARLIDLRGRVLGGSAVRAAAGGNQSLTWLLLRVVPLQGRNSLSWRIADAEITSRGAAVHGIEALKDGLVGHGVLLDIPRLRGTSWLEPGEHVLREELMATIARGLAP